MSEDHEDEEVGAGADGPRAAPRRAGQRGPLGRSLRRRHRPGPPGPASPRQRPGGRCVTAGRGQRAATAPRPPPALPGTPLRRAGTPPKLESHNLFQIKHGHTSGNRLPGGFRRPCPSLVPAKKSEGWQQSCAVPHTSKLSHNPNQTGAEKGIPRTSASFKNKVLFFTCLKSLKFRVQDYSTETSCCPV